MVQPGQFLERPAVIATGRENLVLEGLYHRGEKLPVVLAPPHPLMGGSMDSPVCNEIAFACYKEHHPSLRFNYRGVGASQGTTSGALEDAVADLEAALSFLLDTCDAGRAVVGGYSFGALAAGQLAFTDSRIKALLLIAPPVARLDCGFLRKSQRPMLVICGGRDTYGPAEEVRRLLEGTNSAEVHEIREADHFYSAGLADMGKAVRNWLRDLSAGTGVLEY